MTSTRPTITAFANSPDRGQGLARDMTVRWAFEEVGQPYDVRLVPIQKIKELSHRAVHPFGKIPTLEDGHIRIFESGAIVLHIAESHHGLLPDDTASRARAKTWMFAAFSTVEPPIVELSAAYLLEREKSWYAERLPLLQDNVRTRLNELSNFLGAKDWLEGQFTAGDLVMVSVLRRLASSGLMSEFPNILRYVERAEARPAFRRAFAAQLAVFQNYKESI